MPDKVYHGLDLAQNNVLKGLEKLGVVMGENETVRFFAENAAGLLRGAAMENCLLLSNRRLVRVEAKGSKVLRVNVFEIVGVALQIFTEVCVVLTLMNGATTSVQVASKKVAQFFYRHLTTFVRMRIRGHVRVVKKKETSLLGDSFEELKKAILETSIVKTYRSGIKAYENCVRGSKLVNWLIAKGHATDRASAVQLGHGLWNVGLRHITNEHGFQDKAKRLYVFDLALQEATASELRVETLDQGEFDRALGSFLDDDDDDDSGEDLSSEELYSMRDSNIELSSRMPPETIKEIITRSGLIKNHRHLFSSYPDSLIGSELLDWLVATNHADDRQSAERIAVTLYSVGLRPYCGNQDDVSSFVDRPDAHYHFVIDVQANQFGSDAYSRVQRITRQTAAILNNNAAEWAKPRQRKFNDTTTFYVISELCDMGLVLESRLIKSSGADTRDFELVLAHPCGKMM